MTPVPVRRLPTRLLPDPSRVIARPLVPGDFAFAAGHVRLRTLVERILQLSDEQVAEEMLMVRQRFLARHPDYRKVIEDNAANILSRLPEIAVPDAERRRLLGAFFTQEIAIEAAALFNPSMVPAPGVPGTQAAHDGSCPFVMSVRGTAEGHISCIEFRSGVVTADGDVVLDPPPAFAVSGERRDPLYDRSVFVGKLLELGADETVVWRIVEGLPPEFTMEQLSASLRRAIPEEQASLAEYETGRLVQWLASSNYIKDFDEETALGERVLLPLSPSESRGMEDARFVRFSDGSEVSFYATYTAFDGVEILPQLIETPDFRHFRVRTLNGAGAQNKGLALFPRKVDGQYMMLSRNDRESIFLMRSDNLHWWHNPEFLRGPTHPWELFQIGNCGSPIETEAGWLVLTHGVGAMRRYSIGALLLDLEDPSRIIGDLEQPLLEPDPDERNGYVPNVVYSCGGMVHADTLIIPYGFSDYGSAFAAVDLPALLEALVASPPRRTSPASTSS